MRGLPCMLGLSVSVRVGVVVLVVAVAAVVLSGYLCIFHTPNSSLFCVV